MVGQHDARSQALTQMVRHAFRQAARVDENQGGAVRGDQFGQAVIDSTPHLITRHRAQFVTRYFHRQFHLAAMADVDNLRRVAEEAGDFFQGLYGCRKTDSLRPPGQPVQPRQRERQMTSPLIVRHRVNLIDNHGPHAGEHFARPFGGQQNVERLRRSHQNVRRFAQHPLAIRRARVARSQPDPDGRQLDTALLSQRADLGQRPFQILVNIVAQRLERRAVDHLCAVRQCAGACAADQAVDANEKSRQRLPGTRGSGNRTSSPARMTGQPRSCGSVGTPRRSNHSCTRGSKAESTTFIFSSSVKDWLPVSQSSG